MHPTPRPSERTRHGLQILLATSPRLLYWLCLSSVSPPLRRGDGEEMPLAGHALELVSAAVLELEA